VKLTVAEPDHQWRSFRRAPTTIRAGLVQHEQAERAAQPAPTTLRRGDGEVTGLLAFEADKERRDLGVGLAAEKTVFRVDATSCSSTRRSSSMMPLRDERACRCPQVRMRSGHGPPWVAHRCPDPGRAAFAILAPSRSSMSTCSFLRTLPSMSEERFPGIDAGIPESYRGIRVDDPSSRFRCSGYRHIAHDSAHGT
jgi:hypothetical protein